LIGPDLNFGESLIQPGDRVLGRISCHFAH
jgi:hypothetical protein